MKCSAIENYEITCLTIPTAELLESDGTISWTSTTIVIVQIFTKNLTGIGYTYADKCIQSLLDSLLKEHVVGQNALDIPKIWGSITRAIRNNGREGLTSMAISAIDNALWDLKSKILDVSLVDLLGRCRDQAEVYGSGGFTSQTLPQLKAQIISWKDLGIRRFKMKVGTFPKEDRARVHFVRENLDTDDHLMVDANEAYDFKTAYLFSESFAKDQVSWFEQPLHYADLEGMRELRKLLPPGMKLADGEYIYELSQLDRILRTRSADVIQLDVTRCLGVSGFLKAAAMCEAANLPISSHCAPALHVALACSIPHMKHIEYFFDHARIEEILFDGLAKVENGFLKPNSEIPGFGLVLKSEGWQQWQ